MNKGKARYLFILIKVYDNLRDYCILLSKVSISVDLLDYYKNISGLIKLSLFM